MKEYEFKVYIGSWKNTDELVKRIREVVIEACEDYVDRNTGKYGMLGIEVFKEKLIYSSED